MTNEEDGLGLVTSVNMMMVGEAGVGKTSFMNRFCEDRFSAENRQFSLQVPQEFQVRRVRCEGENLRLLLWDLWLINRGSRLTSASLRGSDIAFRGLNFFLFSLKGVMFCMYDITQRGNASVASVLLSDE